MPHAEHDIFDNRKEFQLDRMILFSDAVFAIAITLLVIEVKVPELPEGLTKAQQSAAIVKALLQRWPEFFGLVMSFAVIGLFWVQHHRLFGLVQSFDNTLLWLNLHLLFWIIIVPFSSSMNSKYGGSDIVWQWYSLNMFFIGLSMFFIWYYIGRPSKKLSVLAHDKVRRKYALTRSLSVASIFLLGFLLCLPGTTLLSNMARFVFCLIFPAMVIIGRSYRRHQKKNPAVKQDHL